MSTEKFNIIFKDYPESFNISEKQRPKYYMEAKDRSKIGVRLLARMQKGDVTWKSLFVNKKSKGLALFDETTNDWVYKNTNQAGKPKVFRINAQVLWQGGHGVEFIRQKMRNYLHTWFVPAIVRQMPEEIFTKEGYYLQFEYIFYYPFAQKENWRQYQDYLNHAFVYSKCFEDTLVNMKIIPDDSPQYIRGGYARYVDIMLLDGQQDRRLEVKIHFCKNNERIS